MMPGRDETPQERISHLEATTAELSRAVATMERRLARLEGLEGTAAALGSRTPVAETAAAGGPAGGAPSPVAVADSDVAAAATLVGRSLLILGGAYLLRALTDAGRLPEVLGILLGFAYALAWVVQADRAASRGRSASAAALGATAALIGYPILWEATTRFHFLAPAFSALAVAAFATLTLAIAWHRRLQPLAWAAGAGAAACGLALLAATRDLPPFTLVLVILGVAGLWLAYDRGWRPLGWVLAGVAELAVLLTAAGALFQDEGGAPGAAAALGMLLCLSFLSAVALHSHGRGWQVGLFEAVQGGAAALIGYGGSALVAARQGGIGAALVGAAGIAMAAGGYAIAFRRIDRQERRGLLFYSGLSFLFLIAGSGLLLSGAALVLVWSALAVAAAVAAVRLSRVTLALHGALYALAAAVASGVARAAAYSLGAPAGVAWPAPTAQALLALGAAAACAALPVPRLAPFWAPLASVTRLLQLIIVVCGLAGAVLFAGVQLLAGHQAAGIDPGLLATARTAVIALAAVLLGAAGRQDRWREASWLVYPVLLAAGVKLVLEDFPRGRPATLFVALGLCGGALILAPRLARRRPA